LANGNDVTGTSVVYGLGETVRIHLEPAEGYALENWNDGQWFDEDWDYQVTGNAAITANLASV